MRKNQKHRREARREKAAQMEKDREGRTIEQQIQRLDVRPGLALKERTRIGDALKANHKKAS